MTPERPEGVGVEPDPRYLLANERTFLAWVRTTLAVVAGAVALEGLGLPQRDGLRAVLVATLLALGATTMLLAYRRWRRVDRAMRRGEPLPPFGLGLLMTVGVLLVVVLLGVVLLA